MHRVRHSKSLFARAIRLRPLIQQRFTAKGPPQDTDSFPVNTHRRPSLDVDEDFQQYTESEEYKQHQRDFAPELVRDFIYDSLYNKSYGYFNKQGLIGFDRRDAGVESDSEELFNWREMKDENEYVNQLQQYYAQYPNAWSTPTELFRPWYARGILRFILNSSKTPYSASNPLNIIEVGGGNGTCAANILQYLQSEHPDIYQHTKYTIVEISQELHRIQTERNKRHGERFRSVNKSITEWKEHISEDCWVLCLEVFDNLPHDKVVITGNALHEVQVVYSGVRTAEGERTFTETYKPCTDPLIIRYLQLSGVLERFGYALETESSDRTADSVRLVRTQRQTHESDAPQKGSLLSRLWHQSTSSLHAALTSLIGGEIRIFVPTMALQLIDTLHRYMPRHRLLVADFDFLQGNTPGQINSPVVQRKYSVAEISQMTAADFNEVRKGLTAAESAAEQKSPEADEYFSQSFNTYLVPKGSCDIFFPTDFDQLQRVYTGVTGRDGSVTGVEKMSSFIAKNAEFQKTQTKSGFNPMIEDYSNMAVFYSKDL